MRMRSSFLYSLLTLCVLFFSWDSARHDADLHAHQGNESCAICIFASGAGSGIPPTAATLPPEYPAITTRLPRQDNSLYHPSGYLQTPWQRGPPDIS